MPQPRACRRGLLVSVEGLSGVGKTHLTTLLLRELPPDQQPLLLQEFSQRPAGTAGPDLGRDLLKALIAAADADHFLRGGHPGTETLLLLAIKMHDYEAHAVLALTLGRLVLEGRSVHSTAVYQSVITHPDDESAYEYARAILALAAGWRPLPDLTILLADDLATALRRAERRDAKTYTTEERRLHDRAARLFERLAWDDPDRITIIDRRDYTAEDVVRRMADLIRQTAAQCVAGNHPGLMAGTCRSECRFAAPAA